MNTQTSTYHVVVYEQSTTNLDRSAVVLRDCGHKHRSPKTAEKCLQKLLAYNPQTDTWASAWHRAQVLASSNGCPTYRPLSDDEMI